MPSVAIAGYTNAGKSSLLNRLTGAGVLVRGRAVRHPRPDRPPGRTPRRPGLHADRHGRLRPAPAAPAGRGVPLHAGGGRPRPTCVAARRRRLRPRPDRPDRRGARGARRDRRRRRARADRGQQDRRRRRRDAAAGCGGRCPARSSSPPRTGEGIDELLDPDRSSACRARTSRCDVLVPYDRGRPGRPGPRDGEVLGEEHTGDGTVLHVRVAPGLAAELQPYRQG